MKVIFLDIDGVLNVIPQGHDNHGAIFHQHFIDNLKYIIDSTNAKIVISSSWRLSGLQAMLAMWEDRSLCGEIIGVTGYRKDLDCFSKQRGTEIQEYVDKHPEIERYVILDDDGDMLPHQWENNFVMCSENFDHEDKVDYGYGLTKKCAEKAISILNLKNP